ncbi:hypothetical protein [Bdellovibrio reynosensis]|uniref:Uncharacterized protein n=1 Tax=Bdellovibrio reynosensis TaxID=2835041 RepID=A0ABY4C9B0_9BACT|nr:hypothetical protein [Bdellovibrio reynosensis]UOF00482.1 hypothetical protein MNR06_12310 [Bdellovibrio reynosensis]
MKKRAFFTAILSLFVSLAASAEEYAFTRGILLAFDTRDHQACEMATLRVKSMAPKADLKALCAQDGRKPISVILVSTPVSEFDFTTEDLKAKKGNSLAIKLSDSSIIDQETFILISDTEELDHTLKIMNHKKTQAVSQIRMAELSALSVLNYKLFSVPFVLRSKGSKVETLNKFAAMLERKAVSIGQNIEVSSEEEEPFTVDGNMLPSIVKLLTTIKSISVDLPKDCDKGCKSDKSFGLSIALKFRF